MTYARDVAAPLTLCALNFEVSIAADCNTDMIHLAIVLGDTGLYGLMKDKNNLETKCQLRKLSVSRSPSDGTSISINFLSQPFPE